MIAMGLRDRGAESNLYSENSIESCAMLAGVGLFAAGEQSRRLHFL
jgi:hypothetical protein